MRWGNNKELIKQDVNDLVKSLEIKLNNEELDINYIDGANHSYIGKEDMLAEEIYKFLFRFN
jgi:alpha/beta superfamily hydrolase